MEMNGHPQTWKLLLLAPESRPHPRCYRTQRAYAFSRAVILRDFVAIVAMRGHLQNRSISRRLRQKLENTHEQLGRHSFVCWMRSGWAPDFLKQARASGAPYYRHSNLACLRQGRSDLALSVHESDFRSTVVLWRSLPGMVSS